MRRRGELIPDGEEAIDITPLIDVVFIMLIFFVVTATFVKEAGIEVNRPSTVTAERSETASILVAVDADDGVWIEGRRVDPRAVRAHVERMRAKNPKGNLVVQADEMSRTKTVMAVVDAARQAGVEEVMVAGQQEGLR